MKISSHYSVTHTSFQIISWSSGFWQKPFPPKQSLENAQQKKKNTAKEIKKQRKQKGEKAKGKHLGGQCQNKPQNVPSVHFKSPEALASGTDSNIIYRSSQLINILGSLSSFWPERDQKMAGLASKVVFCPDWVSTYENNGLTSCKRTPSGLGVSGGAVGLWKVCWMKELCPYSIIKHHLTKQI